MSRILQMRKASTDRALAFRRLEILELWFILGRLRVGEVQTAGHFNRPKYGLYEVEYAVNLWI